MELRLQREPSTDGCTLGTLSIDGRFSMFTCEDVVRAGKKIAHETAIAAGRYRVIINKSLRFGRMLPLICGVPDFTGVRIHPGNTARDTSGCILVGLARGPASVLSSAAAMDVLQPQIAAALARHEDVMITITNAPQESTLKV